MKMSFYLFSFVCLTSLMIVPATADETINICDRGLIGELITGNLGSDNCETVSVRSLNSLESLDLTGHNIYEIPNGAFVGLNSLKKLDICFNEISEVKEGTFKGLTSLEVLSLDANRLTKLPPKTFSKMKDLKKLELSLNQIEKIEENTFSELSNLKELNLEQNPIESLSREEAGLNKDVQVQGVDTIKLMK